MTRRSKHRIHLVSLGCPKNLVDSERMLSLVGGHDYEVTADPEDADVVIVNTCGFIGPAKEESIDAVMEADRLRRDGGKCKGIIVTGCLAQRYEKELKSELPEADLILNLSQEREIVRHIDELLGRTRATYLDSIPRVTMTPDHWAYLRISDGCDHKCAFCAIPLIKGRNKSEPIEVLVAEAEHLATAGVRELVLVAQDSLRYGKDLYGEIRLVPLLEKLAAVEGIQWVRLMYTYPAFWSDELLEFYADSDKMCRYVDMPLQHIADPVSSTDEAGDDEEAHPRPAGSSPKAHAGCRPAFIVHRGVSGRDRGLVRGAPPLRRGHALRHGDLLHVLT